MRNILIDLAIAVAGFLMVFAYLHQAVTPY